VPREHVDVGGLGGAARGDGALAGADGGEVVQRQAGLAGLGAARGKAERRLDLGGADGLAALEPLPEGEQRRLGQLGPFRVAGDGEPVAARGEADAQHLLDARKVSVVLPEEERQQRVVVELEGDRALADGSSVGGGGGAAQRGGAGLRGAERDGGGGRQAGAGSSASTRCGMVLLLLVASMAESELGCAVTARTAPTRPIRLAGPRR